MNESTQLLIENAELDNEEFFFDSGNLLNDVHNVNNVHTLDLSLAVDAGQEAIAAAKLVIDNALAECADNPAILGSVEFANALKIISGNQALWFEYRTKIKDAKPSGVPMADIDAMAGPQSANGDKQDSAAEELIELVMDKGSLFFDTIADKAFVSVDMDGVEHTLAINSKTFVEWLSFAYYTHTKKGNATGKSASETAIKQASFALSGIAKHDGENERVYLRVADFNGGHHLFVGDEKRQVIEVLPTGWRIISNSPVKFWMPGAMQPLPIPQAGGDLSQLWQFVNIPDHERLLVLAWLLEAMRAETPKPILALCGTQGSAKSSTQNKLRQLIDNNTVNLRAAPKSIEDVFVSAGCNWLASFENLSHLTPAMQDALCTLATGGGFASRTLYTNSEETIIEVKRPVIVNSIPSVITAQDLTDRAISIELPRIAYREESEINAAWELAKPSILGGLLDLFVKTLALMPTVKLINPPRMADFTRLGEAMAQALGHPVGTFDTLYKANRAESIGRALEASPVAVALRDIVEAHTGQSRLVFTGTMKTLLERLETHKQESHAWPKSARGLGDILRRQQPALSSLGIDIEISKPGRHGINVEIKKREHREHCERGLEVFHAERKILHSKSVVQDVERF
ncbi:MAG: hypothetical protein Q8Q40_13870 [Methylococcaceae bacterium]|nr:hypothetical protein [Methylococcaceae bacterium]MDP3905044.1 hypothetical protein [Methylococcaceae bacterium]